MIDKLDIEKAVSDIREELDSFILVDKHTGSEYDLIEVNYVHRIIDKHISKLYDRERIQELPCSKL